MKPYGRKFIPVTLIGILAITGYLNMNSSHAAAQGQSGPQVTIVEPLPLPVTGQVAVNGTVQVANQQEPVRLRGACGPINGGCGLVDFTVPTGKRLVIEYVSTSISGQTASGIGVIDINVLAGPSRFPTILNRYPFASAAFFQGFSASSQLVRIYANAGEVVNIAGGVSPFGAANVSFGIEVTGYLIPAE